MESAGAALQWRRHPRIDRPAGLVVDWSPQTIAQRLQQLEGFEQRWNALAPSAQTPIHDQVDYRLLGSAVARVRWELSIEQSWKRSRKSTSTRRWAQSPFFYCRRHRSLSATAGNRRSRQADPGHAAGCPGKPDRSATALCQLAIDSLDQVGDRLQRTGKALAPQFTAANNQALQEAIPAAVTALTQYRAWLTAKLPTARKDTAIGRDNYVFFLRKVALVPYTPEQLLAMSHRSGAARSRSKPTSRLALPVPRPRLFPVRRHR